MAALVLLILSSLTQAADEVELHGISFPRQIQTETMELDLNGYGTRTYGVFNTKIYVAALYLSTPSNDPNTILDGDSNKQITMQYMRKIDQDDMREGWDYYFKQACPQQDCSAYRDAIADFQALVIAAKPKDRYDYRFYAADRVDVVVNGELKGTITGKNFARLLLSTWIGAAPPTEELKKSLLGKV